VRNAGGVLDQVTREVEIEVLPANIPDRVELDVNALKIGDSLHVRDLTIPNAKILTDGDLTIATVVPPRAEEVAAPTPEAATEVAEPELIRKVREARRKRARLPPKAARPPSPRRRVAPRPPRRRRPRSPRAAKRADACAPWSASATGARVRGDGVTMRALVGRCAVARWGFPPFRRGERARVTAGEVDGIAVRVLKPTTYMNASGAASRPSGPTPLPAATDLLVLVDEFRIPAGTFRLRAEGSAGGHNGLKSIEAALQSQLYPRLRIGVGPLPRAWPTGPNTSSRRSRPNSTSRWRRSSRSWWTP